jgi:hypothetical protein
MLKGRGAVSWGVNLSEKDIDGLFSSEKMVYLTGDAEEEMGAFDKEYALNG